MDYFDLIPSKFIRKTYKGVCAKCGKDVIRHYKRTAGYICYSCKGKQS